MATNGHSMLLLACIFSLCALVCRVEGFTKYPAPDGCGTVKPGGGNPGQKPVCPRDTCQQDRKDCEDADKARIDCLKIYNKGCDSDQLQEKINDARSNCDAAAACIQNTCYGKMCGKDDKKTCKVQSYFKGHCCCPN